MAKVEREFLFMAANAELGVELESQDVDRDIQKLGQARAKEKGLSHIQIRRAAEPGKIWLVRLREQTKAEAEGLDVSLEDLEI